MWELFDILPECIITMASILGGMGTGSNTGKISFKKILSSGDLEITESNNALTFNITSGSGAVIGIRQDQMVFGNTVSGITSSSLFITKDGSGGYLGNSLYGFGSIIANLSGQGDTTASDRALNVSSFNNCPGKSIILGGGNSICFASSAVIIGGFTNSIRGVDHCHSVIVGGYYNRICRSCCAAIVSSQCSIVEFSVGHSLIMSSVTSTITSSNKFNSIISSENSRINNYDSTGDDRFNQIVSSVNSYICSTGSARPNCNRSNQILASDCSCIKICTVKNLNDGFSKYNTIGASIQSNISATSSQGLSSSYNSILASEVSCITGQFNSIIGGCRNEILTNCGFSFITKGLNTILSSECVKVCNMENFTAITSCKITETTTGCRIRNVTVINDANTCIKENTCYGTMIAGRCNSMSGILNSILGGRQNNICLRNFSTIIGGSENNIISCTLYNIQLCETVSSATIISAVGTTASFFTLGSKDSIFYSLSSGIGGGCNVAAFSVTADSSCRESINFRTTADHSVIVGGCCNRSDSNKYSSAILGSFKSRILNAKNNIIIGGQFNNILSKGQYYHVDDSDFCNRSNNSFIVGGQLNCLRDADCRGNSGFLPNAVYCLENSGIIGGRCNVLLSNCTCNSVIIGGLGLTSSNSETLIIENLLVSGTFSTSPSSGVICCGVSGTFNNVKGLIAVNGIVTTVTVF